ncbi:hypothetical protein FHS55_000979 [Angulomicrobium tetraedrale]|uniref:Uncharacterized protein n=1 Tax=Ancylobacter tetraedralis TaxID=217068 RepID=A0A839Z5U5_9HYPH|nr:hypothetical protein [Ancylobacter tetraedralis]MBB3770393.1 hypothetical protein [Ancylobacter tetraedralis]
MGELLLFARESVGLLPGPGALGLHEEIEAATVGKCLLAFPALRRPALGI